MARDNVSVPPTPEQVGYGIREVKDDGKHIATISRASAWAVVRVLNATVNDPDGRSEFRWIRLSNGDLILGIYPHGDTYVEVSDSENV